MCALIDILLATYNSAGFLREQLDSLLKQTDQGWRLLIRDAGSTDDTLAIIAEYAAYDSRIRLVEVGKADSCRNFSRLLELSSADYVMFCDHDDVWLPQKIAMARKAMQELERDTGDLKSPKLVFSDAIVTDEKLQTLDESSFHYQHLDPTRLAARQLLLQNVAAGNTMLFNRALVIAATPIPNDAVMHDHWMILVASLLGYVRKIEGEVQLLYRQHGGNVLGAASFSLFGLVRRLLHGRKLIRERLYNVLKQAGALAVRYADDARVSQANLAMLRDVASVTKCGFLMRRMILMRHGIRKNGFMRNLGMMFFI